MDTHLDHLVVAADTLEQGVDWCKATLGVTPGPGGRHALFGTHNRLRKIATPMFEDAYLEIIAIDPQAPSPARPRWFGLDNLALREQLRANGPRLVHAVARSSQLDLHREGLMLAGLHPGDPVQAERDTPQGLLSWEILVRPDWSLPCRGALPTLIQWRGRHPAQGMPDSGVTLQALTLRSVPAAAIGVLRLAAVEVDQATDGPALQARLTTPRGEVTLSSD